MPPEHFNQRRSFRDLGQIESDKVKDDTKPVEAASEVVQVDNPWRHVLHVHDSTRENEGFEILDSDGQSELLKQEHQRNHDHTKQQTLDELKLSVIPAERRSGDIDQQRYHRELETGFDSVFSIEVDQNTESNLERELEAVLAIEAIEDNAERAIGKAKFIAELAERLKAKPKDAGAIYEKLATSSNVLAALKQQRQVLLLLEVDLEKYQTFITLTSAGDEAGIDALIATIENDSVRGQLSKARSTVGLASRVLERRRREKLQISRQKFAAIIPAYDAIDEDWQLALANIAATASPEFLSAIAQSALKQGDSGLEGTWLQRPLLINEFGEGYLGLARIREFSGSGLRDSALLDVTRRRPYRVFAELTEQQTTALLNPFFAFDRIESLPVAQDLKRIDQVLQLLGLEADSADGWMALREWQLVDDQGR